MTADERARAVCEEMASGPLILEVPFDEWVRRQVAEAIRAAVEEEREDCARLAEVQPYYPDTHTGMRQQWVKDQIAAAIRARGGQT
jgi:hypothetical protein